LQQQGFPRVGALLGGLHAWESAGLPVDKAAAKP